jgi:hypothetical protein
MMWLVTVVDSARQNDMSVMWHVPGGLYVLDAALCVSSISCLQIHQEHRDVGAVFQGMLYACTEGKKCHPSNC